MRLSLPASFAVLGAFALVLFLLRGSLTPYTLGLITEALIWALFAMSLDLLMGYAGLPSLGHAAFYGMGAYIAAVYFLRVSPDLWTCLALGVIGAALLALVFGFLALRTIGVSFLMITLALAQVVWGIAYSWRSVTNGDDGLRGIKREGLTVGPLDLGVTGDYFLFVLGIFTVAAAIMLLVVRSPFGYALQGIRESSDRMEALGYHVWRFKMIAFVVAGAFAGLAGVLFAFNKSHVSPEVLSVAPSAEAMLMVIFGGAGTLFGAVVGAFSIVLLSYWVSDLTERWNLILGIIYVLVVVFAPNGVIGLVARLRKRGATR